MKIIYKVITLVIIAWSSSSIAQTLLTHDELNFLNPSDMGFYNQNQDQINAVRDKLLKFDSKAKNFEIKNTKLENYFEVKIKDKVFYIDKEANHMFVGDAILLNEGGASFISETEDEKMRRLFVKSINESDAIIFKAEKETQRLFVFSDITCPYCQKLHLDVKKINDKGITLLYYPYPRAGLNTDTEVALNNVWCTKTKEEYSKANERAKTYIINNSEPKCDNNFFTAYYFTMANKLKIPGTPYIINEKGQVIGGYESYHSFILKALKKW